MVSPILPFAVGALMSRNEIVDRQDELTGQIVDTVAENYLAKSGEEKVRLKNVDKIFNQLTNQYPVQVVEAFAHAGFLDSGDLGTAMNFIQNVKPEAIEKLKTMDNKDLNLVFQNNNSKVLESVGSKENAVAKNLNRGQLKNLSDLYFGNEIKGGKLDTARNLLFGGPVIKEGDVPSAILGLEKETEKIQPDMEEPDQALMEAFASIPGGPLFTTGSGAGSPGVSDAQFRLRQNDAIDIAMASIGLDGTYSRDVNGNPILTKFTDLDGSKFNYVNELVSMSFMQKDFNLNNYRTVGTNVANMVKYNDRLINTAFVNFEKQSSPTVELTPNIEKDKKLVFNQKGYDLFLASAAPVLAGFAKNSSVAYREYVIQSFGKGAYREYFDQYLKDLSNQIPQ
jgi:hypothetical protein